MIGTLSTSRMQKHTDIEFLCKTLQKTSLVVDWFCERWYFDQICKWLNKAYLDIINVVFVLQ